MKSSRSVARLHCYAIFLKPKMKEYYFAQSWRRITDNGKRLCEVREFEELEVQEFVNVANAFSVC